MALDEHGPVHGAAHGLACTAWCACRVYGANDACGGCQTWPQVAVPGKYEVKSNTNMLVVMSCKVSHDVRAHIMFPSNCAGMWLWKDWLWPLWLGV